jgi:ribosomal protein S18 acetylase RimI-like enzyme
VTPLLIQLLLPSDPDVDDFGCGDPEVDNYFVGRHWLKPGGKVSPTVYKFQDAASSAVVGYAAAALGNCPHLIDASTVKARYLRIDAAGLNTAFQGLRPPNDSATYAEHVFRELEALARAQRLAKGCVGLSLWVRSVNTRAIRFYEKAGFVADPGGAQQRFPGPPHLTMRKLF